MGVGVVVAVGDGVGVGVSMGVATKGAPARDNIAPPRNERVEAAVVQMAFEQPAFGQLRTWGFCPAQN